MLSNRYQGLELPKPFIYLPGKRGHKWGCTTITHTHKDLKKKTVQKHTTSETSQLTLLRVINTVWIFKHFPEPSLWVFADNWHTESKMYSLWFIHPTCLHFWLNAFCPHPDTGVLSWGIGCPRGALPVNWSGPDSSLVHPHWKPQMRCSANAFVFIRWERDKVSWSFWCCRDGYKKLKADVPISIERYYHITTLLWTLQGLFNHSYSI